MTPRSRVRWSFAVAVAAHALALTWTLARGRAPSTEQPSDPRAQPTEMEIAVEPPPTAPPAEVSPSPSPSPSPDLAPQAVATHAAPRSQQSPGHPLAASAEPAPVVSAEPAGSASWTFSPTSPATQAAQEAAAKDKARGEAIAAGVREVLAQAEKKAADRARKPLIFTSRDLDTGLVPGGQYVALARERVRTSLTPDNGHALLEFWTDSRGIVARVRVLDATSDERAWNEVADALVEDARTSFPLKVPSNADGLIVTLDVTSALKTLSGAVTTQNPLVKALRAIQNPVDTVLDAKASPRRVVWARVVRVEAF